jgi:hypothetical protein
MKVSPDAVALKEIKTGDQVEVKYLEAVALAIENPKATPATAMAEETVQVASEQGTFPEATAVKTSAITAQVEDLDRKNRIVTLRDSAGNRLIMKASPDVLEFANLKIGDHIRTRYTEAIAFEVHRAS